MNWKWVAEEISVQGGKYAVLSVLWPETDSRIVVASWWRRPGVWFPTPFAVLGGAGPALVEALEKVGDPYDCPLSMPFELLNPPVDAATLEAMRAAAYGAMVKALGPKLRRDGFDG